MPAKGAAGGADVRPLCHAFAVHGEKPAGRLRGLCDRLAQRPRHSGIRRQVRYRGLHPLSGGFHARDGPRHPCDRGLPTRPPDAGGHRLSGRTGPRRAAAHPDPDRRTGRSRCRRDRRDRFRPSRDNGPIGAVHDPTRRLQISGRWTQGLSGAAATVVLHVDERGAPRQRLFRPDCPRDARSGLGPRRP